ncbi:hypothetical protein Murru_0213 [Allomuricauda ruestringensis DSM 13258]|uniref:Uncharacterized protein n=1 Tax=Allomuricauda ruestringensis (strain DSM 13258 / CIP 107369 / LMG 19739 / B1) TaxID=886377 RepID=G2PR88_ALLRU|nr:hypothetical protein [Allomuricauda ruestringensis]AEM69269.1 hypothetical protein Murru_0213 [Allomuricauda ruestringensis DSM 13258]
MKSVNRPYFHESISQIISKKDKLEITNWTETMEGINEELQYLIQLEKRLLGNPSMHQRLLVIQRENQLRLGTLYRYEQTMVNAIECDTMECDAYYLNTHEKNRDGYMAHIKSYSQIKLLLLSKILERFNRKPQ